MKNTKRNFSFLLILATVILSFLLGYSLKTLNVSSLFFEPKETDFSLILEAYDLLKKESIYWDRVDDKKLIHGAVAGMVNSLNDPHTNFFNTEDTKRFLEDTDGKFEGVGMEVGIRDSSLQVISPLKGTPAERAGLLPGDKILEIDKQKTDNFSLEESVNLIRGPKNTDVSLLIYRSGWKDAREFIVTRDIIELPSIEWELIDNNIAHIKLYHFYRKAGNDFNEIALEIINSPAEKIVLDLRGNSGGYLHVSTEIGGWFLEKGETFLIEEYPGSSREEKVRGSGRLRGYPTVVLIDRGSASASEILAGALRDNREIKLIGETSFGKGSIQRLERLSDGSSLKITVARWLTPNGIEITEKGLVPDIKVILNEEEYLQGKDNQLREAVEVIRNLI